MNSLFEGKMTTSRILMYPSILRLFTFLAIATFLSFSGRSGNALASPLESDSISFAPGNNGYPSDAQIREAFLGVSIHHTVLGAIKATEGVTWLFATSTGRVSLYNAFEAYLQPFLREGYGPKEGFSDFMERSTKFFIGQSAGRVWVLSDWPNGPDERRDCIWREIQFPNLKKNVQVTSIWLVDRDHFQRQKQIWPSKTETKTEEKPNPQPPSGRRRGGRPQFGLAPLVGVGGAGFSLGTGLGGVSGLETLPFVLPIDNNNDPDTPGVKSDVLDSTVGKLPSTINEPAGGGEMTTTLGTDASGNGNLFGDLDKDWNDFGTPTRRHLGLQARFGPACDWSADPSTTPNDPSPSDQTTDNSIVPPPSNYVAPGAISSLATVQVTEYEGNLPAMDQTGHPHLEISISNTGNEVIGGLQATDAPPGQDLIVWSNLPYALRVSLNEEVLSFKYAWDTPYAISWDMNDPKCKIGPWNAGIRGVYCDFTY